MTATLRYEDIAVGHVYGSHEIEISAELLHRWMAALDGDEDTGSTATVLPREAWSVIVMPAIIECVGPRPAGTIHARQRLRFSRSPTVGEVLTATVAVTDKFVLRQLSYVVQEVIVRTAEGEHVLTGWTSTVWPTDT
jgi:N-terminal half of MaoC dehydratase